MEKPWLYIFVSWIATVISTATGYIQIVMIERFTNLFSEQQLTSFWVLFFIFLSSFLVFIVLTWFLKNYAWCIPQFGMQNKLIEKYFHKYFVSENNIIEQFGTGRLLWILVRWLETWPTVLNELLNNIFRWVLMLGLSVGILWSVSLSYIPVFILMFILVMTNLIIFSHYGSYWRTKRKERYVERGRQEAKMIMSKFEVLQNNTLEKEIKNMCTYNYDIQYLSEKIQGINVGTWQFSRIIIAAFSLYICVSFYNRAVIEWVSPLMIAQLGAIMWLLATFTGYFNLLIDWYINFTKEFVHVEKFWDFIDQTPQIKGYDTGDVFRFKKWNFCLEDLTFSYGNSSEVLSNFSLTIQWGKRTAFVGRSWSGKTTLMKLIAGYMRPTSWELLIDGQNITSIRLDSYYPHIWYLTQEPSVFDGTIEENLLYGTKKKPTKKDIERAIELSECQFIYELENWLKTEIWERWVRLSGWQKQRLAIAKIFLKDPEIILLDEPTAALDSYSEQKIAKAFEHLFVWRTVIVIAHRLQTVKSADDIIVLEKGKIVERWTHAELLKLGKKYAGMVDLQSGVVREEEEELRIKN